MGMYLRADRISDERFFLELLHPGMEGYGAIEAAARSGDFTGARAAFARAVRARGDLGLFLTLPYEPPENLVLFDNEDILAAANRICEGTLMSCGTPHNFGKTVDWELNPTYNQYNEWPWQLNRHNEWKILAEAYRQTRDMRYARRFAELFAGWYEQAVPPVSGTDHGETQCWRTIEAGIRLAANWPYAFFVFLTAEESVFTDDLLTDWYKSIWEHGRRLRDDYSNANWVIMEMVGLAHIGILFKEFRDGAAWTAFAIETLREELHKQVYPDGFQYELTTNYHDCFVKNYYRLILTAGLYGVELPADYEVFLNKTLDVYAYLVMPDGRLPDINDGTKEKVADLLRPKLFYVPRREDLKWLATNGEQGSAPAFKSVGMPYSGLMIFRDGFSAGSTYALFDAGPFGRGHQHEDKLSLLLYANGRLILTEGGNYAYDTSEMRRYVSATRSHNTVMVNGRGQNRWQRYGWKDEWIGQKSDMVFGLSDAADFAEGVYDEGYGPDFLNARHRRKVVFFKEPPLDMRAFFVIFDEISAEGENARALSTETLFHIDSEQIALDDLCVRTPTLHISSAAFPDADLCMSAELVRGQTRPEWQGFAATGFHQGDFKPVYCLRYRAHSESGLVRAAYLLQTQTENSPVEHFCLRADGSAVLGLRGGKEFVINPKDFGQ